MEEMRTEQLFPEGFALVVGASGGVGQAIALELARSGANVALTYRHNEQAAQSVADAILAMGQRAMVLQLDLANYSDLVCVFEKLSENEGGVHTVVCAAGAAIEQPYISQTDPGEFQSVITQDLGGFFNLTRAALKSLRASAGSLLAITSAGLQRFPTGDILSVAPKGGIEAIVRGVAREEGRFGVRANCVALGVIEAGMFHRLEGQALSETWMEAAKKNIALRRFGQASEVAQAAVFLTSSRASYVTGQTLMLDGGYTI